MNKSRSGFTLLEVVIALAMLAVMAVPALGLATMAVAQNRLELSGNAASELKDKVDVALRCGFDVFDPGLAEVLTLYASTDLSYIEIDGAVSDKNDRYYKVLISEVGLFEGETYRVFGYDIRWPNPDLNIENGEDLRVLYSVSVFRK